MLKTKIAGTRVPAIYVLEQNKKIMCTPVNPSLLYKIGGSRDINYTESDMLY